MIDRLFPQGWIVKRAKDKGVRDGG